MRRLGVVTIGQSPRDDVVPELRALLPKNVIVVETGALDGLSKEEIPPPQAPERTLVTRLSDGTELQVDKAFVHGRLEAAVRSLETRVDLIAYLCS
ncbi:MAG TPA: AroM family protein, partial [Candidatus Acetothermia bacterium]|nr:AroM family protein [Candidatus Acetothermia bacterium]